MVVGRGVLLIDDMRCVDEDEDDDDVAGGDAELESFLIEKRRVLEYMQPGGGIQYKTVSALEAYQLHRIPMIDTRGFDVPAGTVAYDCDMDDVVVFVADCEPAIGDDDERSKFQSILRRCFHSLGCSNYVEFLLVKSLYFKGTFMRLLLESLDGVNCKLAAIKARREEYTRYIRQQKCARAAEIENDQQPSESTWKYKTLVSILESGGRSVDIDIPRRIGEISQVLSHGARFNRSLILFDESFRRRIGVRGNGDRKAFGMFLSSLLTHAWDCAHQFLFTTEETVFRGVVDGAKSIRRFKQYLFLSKYGRQLILFEVTKMLKSSPSYVDGSVDANMLVEKAPEAPPCPVRSDDFPVPYSVALADLVSHIAQVNVGRRDCASLASDIAVGVPIHASSSSSSSQPVDDDATKKQRVARVTTVGPLGWSDDDMKNIILPAQSSTYLHCRDMDFVVRMSNHFNRPRALSTLSYPERQRDRIADYGRAFIEISRKQMCRDVHSCSFEELKRNPFFGSVLKHAINLALDSVRVDGSYHTIGSPASRDWLMTLLLLPTIREQEEACRTNLNLPGDFAMDIDDSFKGTFTFNSHRFSIECLDSVDAHSAYIGVYASMSNFDLLCPRCGFDAVRILPICDDNVIKAVEQSDAAFAKHSSNMRRVMHYSYEALVVSSLNRLPMTEFALNAMGSRDDTTFHNDPRLYKERIGVDVSGDTDDANFSCRGLGVPLPCTSTVPIRDRIVPSFSSNGFRPYAIFAHDGAYRGDYDHVYNSVTRSDMTDSDYLDCTGEFVKQQRHSLEKKIGKDNWEQFKDVIFGILIMLFKPSLTSRHHELLYKHAIANSYGPRIGHKLDATTHVKSMLHDSIEYERLVVLADVVCGRYYSSEESLLILHNDVLTTHKGTVVKQLMDNFADHVVRTRAPYLDDGPCTYDSMANTWLCERVFLVDAAALIGFLLSKAPRVGQIDPIKRLLPHCISEDYNAYGRVITKAMPAHRMYDGLEKLLRRLCAARKINTVMHRRQRHYHIV